MLQPDRHNAIMKLLKERKNITAKELCSILYVSSATIRRDLAALEKKGLLTRSFGGAVLNEIFPGQIPLSVRSQSNVSEKKKIAAKAAAMVTPGETIFMDASTTTYFMLPYLRNVPDLTVITNNPQICLVLAEYKIRNYCTGGEMLNDSVAFGGSHAEQYIRKIRATSMFFSARGIDESTITDSSILERDIKIAMMECSKRKIFLCDEHKSGKRFPYVIANVSDVDEIIRG